MTQDPAEDPPALDSVAGLLGAYGFTVERQPDGSLYASPVPISGGADPEPIAPAPEYAVGDQVTVGGIQFTKHAEWPDPDGGEGFDSPAVEGVGEAVRVTALPPCDIHRIELGTLVPAQFDGKTKRGPWAYMCPSCMDLHGVGLGTGRGQRLVVVEIISPPDA